MRAPLVGALVWVGTVAAAAAGLGQLTLIDAMLLLAVLVIVPVAIPLHPAGDARIATVAIVFGGPAAPALLLDQGGVAAALAAPWLLATAVGALAGARWWQNAGRRVRDLVWLAAPAYLAFGAAWLVADRLDLEPAGFTAPFVQLTAVHFHYAGFASAVLVGCAWRWKPHSRTAATAVAATIAAPPIIAVGFTYVGVLQIAGAALLTFGLWLLAFVTVRHVVPQLSGPAAPLLVVSSIAVLVPMVLAVQWAVGANLGTPALSIPDMARAHGVTNALGFTLSGVIGWRLAREQAD